jgi:hypothetical protein
MKQIRKRADELVLIAAAIGPWTLLVVAVLIIGTLKCCLTTDSDSIDESMAQFENLGELVKNTIFVA